MNDFQCKECGQGQDPILVFVKTMEQHGATVQLSDGAHAYCAPCRQKLGISDELNVGRDLRAEARQVTLDAVAEVRQMKQTSSGWDEGIDHIMNALGPWVGGTDMIFGMMGRPSPERPPEIFDGVSDALREIDPATLTVRHMGALITTINTVRSRIKSWKDFVERSHEHLQQTMLERADAIMKGFV